VFSHALNLRDEHGLIAIADPSVGAVPFGLVLAEPIDFDRLALRRGDLVSGLGRRVRRGALVAPSPDSARQPAA
jgi:hypothetical protein